MKNKPQTLNELLVLLTLATDKIEEINSKYTNTEQSRKIAQLYHKVVDVKLEIELMFEL